MPFTPEQAPLRLPRIAMATEFWAGCTGRGLAMGFRRAGFDVAEIDLGKFIPLANGLIHRSLVRLQMPLAIAAYNRRIIDTCDQIDADLLLTVKGSYITSSTLKMLAKKRIPSVNFYPDVEYNHDGSAPDALAQYAQIVTTKSYHLPTLEKLYGAEKVAFVHHGYDPNVHARRHNGAVPYRWDISFVGNASAYKFNFLLAVARAFPDRRIAIIGNRWAEMARGTPLAPHVLGHPLIGDFFARALEESRINIALHHGPVPPRGWQDLTSTRTFEIPASGGFMLHIDNPEVSSLFTVGEEIDVFSDPKSLCERIDYYLTNGPKRISMADAAHRRCTPAYSLDVRASEIAALLNGRGLLGRAAT